MSKAAGDSRVIVTARGVSLRRGRAVVVSGLDLDLRAGELLAITGRSGAGKSTLLAAIAGLLRPESGSIAVCGREIQTLSDRRRASVRRTSTGLVFQGDEFLPELTLGENVMLPLLMSGRRRASDCQVVVQEVLDRLQVGELAQRYPSEVSMGQLQRAAVARALVHRPPLILADEPTASLDPQTSRNAIEMLLGEARENGAAVIVVTHDSEIAAMCDRHLALEAGSLSSASVGRT